jgi:hypothetical protein
VTHRDAHRLAFAFDLDLSAPAGGRPDPHLHGCFLLLVCRTCL